MAIRTISNGGGNYNTGSTWAEGIVPTSADDVIATSTSGQLTVNVASAAKTFDLSTYTNTLTMNNSFTVSGNITLGSGMTITGSGTLTINATSTLTSNGKSWNTPFSFANISNSTVTLADDWTGTSRVSNGTSPGVKLAVNGNNFYCLGNLQVASSGVISGSTKFVMAGTGTISGGTSGSYIQNDIDINTSGTITFGPTLLYNTGTLRYISGNTITTGSTLDLRDAQTTKLDTSGMTWNNITNTNTATVTLLSDLYLNGSLINSVNPMQINGTGTTIYVGGGITCNTLIYGTAPIVLTGTGTWSGPGQIRSNLTIDTSGTITLGTNLYYNTGTLSYSAGTVIATAATLTVNAGTTTKFNTSGMTWNSLSIPLNATATVTLLSDLNLAGSLSVNQATFTCNGANLYIGGNLNHINGAFMNGSSTYIMNGTGTWSHSNQFANYIANKITFNTSGTITISGIVRVADTTITYISGTMITTGSTLVSLSNITLNTSGMTWNNFLQQSPFTRTITLLSDLYLSGGLQLANTNTGGFITINGYKIYVGGSYFYMNSGNADINGTTEIVITSACTWTGVNTPVVSQMISNKLTVKSGATVTVVQQPRIKNNLFTVESGATFGGTGEILLFDSCSLDTNGVLIYGIRPQKNTQTLNSPLNVTNLSVGDLSTVNFTGNYGFSADTFICTTAGRIINFKSGNTYNCNNLTLRGTNASRIQFKSSTANAYTYFNLTTGGTCDVKFTTAIDVDSSGGRLITNVKGTLLRTINWYVTNPDYFTFF